MTDTATGRKDQLTIGEVRTYSDLPVHITHSDDSPRVTVEAQTCATCRYWAFDDTIAGDVLPPERWGLCSRAGFSAGFRAIPSGDYQGDCDFVTREDFDCQRYQQRGGE